MRAGPLSCVLLADRHHGLSEGIRGLLETVFQVVVMVADETSLVESARRLEPGLAVVDLSLPRSQGLGWLADLRSRDPSLKVILLSVHDQPSVCVASMDAGVNGFVLKRDIATDLLTAIDAVLAGGRYISTGILNQLSVAERDRLMEKHD